MILLTDCISKAPATAELFIVEEKNYELASDLRDRFTQAVLAISPTIPEIQHAELHQLLTDPAVHSIIAALGVGIEFMPGMNLLKLENLRYGKIIIATEPTDDGRHVQTQVLAFMRQYMNPVIAKGHVYLAPEQNWSSLPLEEFNTKAMIFRTRMLTQV